MNRRTIFLLSTLIGFPFFFACQAEPPTDDTLILSTFYPIQLAVRNIAGGIPGVRVENLTRPASGCLHHHVLTTDEMLRLERASILVINGLGLETFLEPIWSRQAGLKVVDASRGIEPIVDARTGVTNAHVWVSVGLAMRQVRNIAEGLAACDPGHAARYRANASAYLKRLRLLQDEMASALALVPRREIITFHEAFPYFAREFDLRVVGVIEREPGSEPSAGELADTIALVKRTRVRTLFAEPQYSRRASETIARATGTSVATLDPVVSGPDRPDAYLELMRTNLAALKMALE
jgi:zinc transport system substrate-binding protein